MTHWGLDPRLDYWKMPIFDIPDGHVHIIPQVDVYPHVENEGCPCRPEWDKQNQRDWNAGIAGAKCFMHNRYLDYPV